MKFTATTADLARAVKTVRKAAPTRPSWELLGGFKVEALDGIVAITATDLDAGRRVEIEAKIEAAGEMLMPPRFPSLVAAANGETTTIDGGTITSGRSRWKLEPLNIDDYPAEPNPEGDPVTLTDWSRIQAVATACSIDGKRPVLAGVCFADGHAAATDSYRLAWTDTETPDVPMNIGARAIAALDSSPSSAVCDGRLIKATTEDGAWWSRLIEGSFPAWRSLIPKTDPTCRITVDAEALVDVIARARLVMQPEWPITIEAGTGELIVKNAERFSEAIEAKVEGEPITASYNPGYLVDLISPVAEATISLLDDLKPARIDGDGWWNALLMPVRA